MTIEVENKFPCSNLDHVRLKLQALGATLLSESPELQVDRYYNHPEVDYSETREALRIRRVGCDNYFTYKGPGLRKKTKTRLEIEIGTDPGERGAEQASAFLLALGFRDVAEVRKRRTRMTLEWQGKSVEAALDEVDSLGSFVEIEILCDEPNIGDAQKAILALARELDLGRPEPRTYLGMLLELPSG